MYPDLSELILKVLNWANERGILIESDAEFQSMKTLEEATELLWATKAGDTDEIKDAIGDIMVTLILVAHLSGTDIHQCLYEAYMTIKDRKGRMINKVFVKE